MKYQTSKTIQHCVKIFIFWLISAPARSIWTIFSRVRLFQDNYAKQVDSQLERKWPTNQLLLLKFCNLNRYCPSEQKKATHFSRLRSTTGAPVDPNTNEMIALSSNLSYDLHEVNSTRTSPEYHLMKLLHPKFVFYSCLMVLTIFSNSYVMCVVLRHKSNFRSWRLNLFLVHLAVAGLLVSITTMPATLISIPTGGAWIFGENLCKVRFIVWAFQR